MLKTNQALHDKYIFRSILKEEGEQAVAIEQICFPPHEACSREHILERIDVAPDIFLVAVDKETGKLAGFLNGLTTKEEKFRDEFFTDINLYDESGDTVMLLGLDVLPEHRGQGLAREIVYEYAKRAHKKGCKRLVLTCLEEKIPMYEKFGFVDHGLANSTWGGEAWHEMSIETKASLEAEDADDEKGKIKKKSDKSKNLIIKTGCILFLICAFLAFANYENKHLVVSEYEIASGKLANEYEGYKILVASDLQNASFGKDNKKLIEKIKAQEPDIIVIPGDIIDANHTNIEVALTFAEQLPVIAPTYFVTGNHEWWLSEEERNQLLDGLKEAGVMYIDNSATITDQNGPWLIGLSDQNIYDPTLENLVNEFPDDTYKIALIHEPQAIKKYSESGVDLVISGHAHGGQFRLPLVGPLIAPDQGFFPAYTSGVHEEGEMKMVISRGLGNSVVPLRLFNDPEIVIIKLKCE